MKRMKKEEQMILMVESKSSDPINQRYKLDEEERHILLISTSTLLCLVLIIFPTLKMSLSGGELHDIVVTILILLFVLLFQIIIFVLAAYPLFNNNNCIPGIIYFIILITSVISFIEVSLVSWIAATITLIFWGFLTVLIFIFDLMMELDAFLKSMTKNARNGQCNIERMLTSKEWEKVR
ncbi:unnamed protein product [Trifolium pratense]|uniref:Uncharacterized protein n=1 Tax=Trifolium pratense TaxID=57577 RepID=A0ACB0L905_TRIPR|nr:unnamed protein product [Trifolium pratense]